jgi:hypothetical protein
MRVRGRSCTHARGDEDMGGGHWIEERRVMAIAPPRQIVHFSGFMPFLCLILSHHVFCMRAENPNCVCSHVQSGHTVKPRRICYSTSEIEISLRLKCTKLLTSTCCPNCCHRCIDLQNSERSLLKRMQARISIASDADTLAPVVNIEPESCCKVFSVEGVRVWLLVLD